MTNIESANEVNNESIASPMTIPKPVRALQNTIAKPERTQIQRPIRKELERGESKEALRDDIRAPKRVSRRKRDSEEEDPLYVDPKDIPDGLSVEWKRISCYGKPDPTHLVKLKRQGWEECRATDWPQIVGEDYEGKTVDVDGMRLMQRPIEYTEEARQEDYEIANEVLRNKMQQVNQTPDGQLQRKVQKLTRSYERAPIPVDK